MSLNCTICGAALDTDGNEHSDPPAGVDVADSGGSLPAVCKEASCVAQAESRVRDGGWPGFEQYSQRDD